jgi:hypothetical protein
MHDCSVMNELQKYTINGGVLHDADAFERASRERNEGRERIIDV